MLNRYSLKFDTGTNRHRAVCLQLQSSRYNDQYAVYIYMRLLHYTITKHSYMIYLFLKCILKFER